jgi:D123
MSLCFVDNGQGSESVLSNTTGESPTLMSAQPSALFPTLTTSYILAFQFSSWYSQFANLSIKSTIIRPLSQQFRDYLDADGVLVPEGSEDVSVYANAQAQTVIMTFFPDQPNACRPMTMTTTTTQKNPQNAFHFLNSTSKSGNA